MGSAFTVSRDVLIVLEKYVHRVLMVTLCRTMYVYLATVLSTIAAHVLQAPLATHACTVTSKYQTECAPVLMETSLTSIQLNFTVDVRVIPIFTTILVVPAKR